MFVYILINENNYPIGTYADVDDAKKNKKDGYKVLKSNVIEHLSPVQLEQTMRNLGRQVKTQKIVLTTPNRSWNAFLGDDIEKRHDDHQFEWNLNEAHQWASEFASRFNLTYQIAPIGRELTGFGSPSIGLIFQAKS